MHISNERDVTGAAGRWLALGEAEGMVIGKDHTGRGCGVATKFYLLPWVLVHYASFIIILPTLLMYYSLPVLYFGR